MNRDYGLGSEAMKPANSLNLVPCTKTQRNPATLFVAGPPCYNTWMKFVIAGIIVLGLVAPVRANFYTYPEWVALNRAERETYLARSVRFADQLWHRC